MSERNRIKFTKWFVCLIFAVALFFALWKVLDSILLVFTEVAVTDCSKASACENAVKTLTRKLNHREAAIRAQGAEDLFRLWAPDSMYRYGSGITCRCPIGPEVKEVVPALSKMLREPEEVTRRFAAMALWSMGPKAKDAVPALIGAVEDKRGAQSGVVGSDEWAVKALGVIGAGAQEAVPTLLKQLKFDDRKMLAAESAGALGLIGREVPEVVLELIKGLQSPVETMRRSSAYALGRIGPQAKEAIPALINTQDDTWRVRHAAIEALGLIGLEIEQTVPMLIKCLKDPKQILREEAATALGNIGPRAKRGVPALFRLLENENEGHFVRRAAAVALGNIGPGAKEAVPTLVRVKQELEREIHITENYALREEIDRALKKIRLSQAS